MAYRRDSRSADAELYRPLYKTARWRVLREAQLCAEPLCRMCLERGLVTGATVCDHVDPVKWPAERFFAGPFQSLCEPCHNGEKQQIERIGYSTRVGLDGFPVDPEHPANGGNPVGRKGLGAYSHPVWFRPTYVPLTIVCGPPASGKSSYVHANKAEGDLVFDLDAIAVKAYGCRLSHLDKDRMLKCIKARNQALGSLMWAKARGTAGRAWLIVSEPDAAKRQWWHDTVRPERIVVLETPAAQCIARAKADKANARTKDIAAVITKWWATYTRRSGEEQVTPST